MDTQMQLQAIEEKQNLIDQQRDTAVPRLAELQARRKTLQVALSEKRVDQSLKPSKSIERDIEKVRAEIAEINEAIAEETLRLSGLDGAKERYVCQELALKLAHAEEAYRQLVPELEKLTVQLFKDRDSIAKGSKRINEVQRALGRYQMVSHELRQTLGMPPADLPIYKTINWNDSKTHISVDQLRGDKYW